MNLDLLLPLLSVGGTLLLVVTALMNFSVFVRQLHARGAAPAYGDLRRGRAGATRVLAPRASLAPWVEHFWIQERLGDATRRAWRIVPDHAAHVIFAVGATDAGERSWGCVVGARRVHEDVDVARRRLTVGARLRLGAIVRLTRSRAEPFNGWSIPLEQIFGPAGRELVDRMSQGDPEVAVEHLSRFLEERLAGDERDGRFETAVRSAGDVAALAGGLGVSVRAAYTRAVETTGLSPKRLLRIVRLHRALALAERREASWSAVAYGAGYADQAHLVREFRSLLGGSPGAWRRRWTSDSFNTDETAMR